MSGFQTNAPAPFLPPPINNNVVLRQTSVANVDATALNAYHLHLFPWQLQNLYQNNYDPFWMQTYHINPVVLNAFSARQKLEHLVYHGVLLPRDVLEAPAAHDDTGLVERTSELTTGCGGGKTYPDFAVLVRDHLGYSGLDRQDCHGTSEILQDWNAIHRIGGVAVSAAWRQLRVRRGNVDLGTLHDLRQGFSYYSMLIDGFLGVTGQRSTHLQRR